MVTVDVLIGTFLGQARADAQSAGAARARARRSHKRAAAPARVRGVQQTLQRTSLTGEAKMKWPKTEEIPLQIPPDSTRFLLHFHLPRRSRGDF